MRALRLVFSDDSGSRAALARLKLENLDSGVLGEEFPDATITVAVANLETLENVWESSWPIRFTDPLRAFRLIFRLPGIVFPAPGGYQVSVLADGEWLAQFALEVTEKEE